MKKIWSILLVAAFLMAAVIGCAGTQTPNEPVTPPSETVSGNDAVTQGNSTNGVGGETGVSTTSTKDTLVIAHEMDCGDLNPHGLTSNSYVKIKIQSYETLIYQDFSGNLIPQLATEWEWLDDCSLQIKLREGVKFHNGETMTAEDVMFTLKTVASSSASYPVEEINWDKSEIVDEHTIILRTDEAFTPLIANLTYFPTAIFSKAGYEADGGTFTQDIGTGPYVITDWVESDHVTQTAFNDYWGGVPAIKTIEWKVIDSETNRAVELESGGCDLAYNVNQLDKNSIEAAGNVFIKFATNDENTIHFNMGMEIFQNEVLRKAFAYSFDRDKATAVGWNNANQPTALFLDPNHPMAFKDEADVAAAGGEVITFDLQKAKELFEQAGYDGRVFQIATGPYETFIASAEAWAADLESIGVKTEIVSFDGATYVNDIKVARNFEICFWGTAPLNGDWDYFARHYYGKSPSTLNISQNKNDEFDALVEAYDREQDVAKATDIARQAQLILYSEYYAIPINQTPDIFAHVSNLKGFTDGSYQSPILKTCYFE